LFFSFSFLFFEKKGEKKSGEKKYHTIFLFSETRPSRERELKNTQEEDRRKAPTQVGVESKKQKGKGRKDKISRQPPRGRAMRFYWPWRKPTRRSAKARVEQTTSRPQKKKKKKKRHEIKCKKKKERKKRQGKKKKKTVIKTRSGESKTRTRNKITPSTSEEVQFLGHLNK